MKPRYSDYLKRDRKSFREDTNNSGNILQNQMKRYRTNVVDDDEEEPSSRPERLRQKPEVSRNKQTMKLVLGKRSPTRKTEEIE